MDKISEINKIRAEMFGKKLSKAVLKSRKNRLKALVDVHGHEAVAAASGLSCSSLVTYLRTKHPRLAESSLAQAEEILARIQ